MTTSGVTTYSVTRDDIIKASLRVLKVLATGETPTPTMVTEANQALNMMIKTWQARDIGLWLNHIITIALVVGQTSYTLGPSGATGNTIRPLDIIEARVKTTSNTETPVELVSRDEYMTLTVKNSTGKINMAYYDPQTTNGKLYVWPTADDATDVMLATVKYPVEVFVNLNDTPDFPAEWFEAIKYNLATRLFPEYDVPDNHAAKVAMLAQQSMKDTEDFDREHTSVRFAYRAR